MKAYRLEVDRYRGTLTCLVVAESEEAARGYAIKDDSVWDTPDVRATEVDLSECAGIKRFDFLQKEVTV